VYRYTDSPEPLRCHGRRTPSLLRHSGKQLGYVKIHGSFTYLGAWPDGREQPPDEVWQNYQRVVSEYRARGGAALPRHAPQPNANVTVAELVACWLKWAETYYTHPDGTQTGELHACRSALRPLVHLYGRTAACEFGQSKLKAVRQAMIDGYDHPVYGPQPPLSRALINMRVRRCVRVFRWGADEELVPAEVCQAKRSVRGLPKGRGQARETEPVGPADEEVVEATLPHLQPSPRAMVQLQLLTGMRPGEVCRLTLGELDRSSDVWHLPEGLRRPLAPQPAEAHVRHQRPRPARPGGRPGRSRTQPGGRDAGLRRARPGPGPAGRQGVGLIVKKRRRK
jgi:hypothetical protein